MTVIPTLNVTQNSAYQMWKTLTKGIQKIWWHQTWNEHKCFNKVGTRKTKHQKRKASEFTYWWKRLHFTGQSDTWRDKIPVSQKLAGSRTWTTLWSLKKRQSIHTVFDAGFTKLKLHHIKWDKIQMTHKCQQPPLAWVHLTCGVMRQKKLHFVQWTPHSLLEWGEGTSGLPANSSKAMPIV